MSFSVIGENTIVKCEEPTCQLSFSVISYAFADDECTVINTSTIVPMTGNTPYYCPACGSNLGKPE